MQRQFCILGTYYGDDTSVTALFCEIKDNFFDVLNLRNTSESNRNGKSFLKPYQNIDHPKFDWL